MESCFACNVIRSPSPFLISPSARLIMSIALSNQDLELKRCKDRVDAGRLFLYRSITCTMKFQTSSCYGIRTIAKQASRCTRQITFLCEIEASLFCGRNGRDGRFSYYEILKGVRCSKRREGNATRKLYFAMSKIFTERNPGGGRLCTPVWDLFLMVYYRIIGEGVAYPTLRRKIQIYVSCSFRFRFCVSRVVCEACVSL